MVILVLRSCFGLFMVGSVFRVSVRQVRRTDDALSASDRRRPYRAAVSIAGCYTQAGSRDAGTQAGGQAGDFRHAYIMRHVNGPQAYVDDAGIHMFRHACAHRVCVSIIYNLDNYPIGTELWPVSCQVFDSLFSFGRHP